LQKIDIWQALVHGNADSVIYFYGASDVSSGREHIYLSQELKFVKPVFIGETITVKVKVMEKNDGKRRSF
jgi:3-hydroxybutyryl-CoA dehydratase